MVSEKTLESGLESKEVKPVNPKGNYSWIFIGRTGAEAPILWPPDAKNWLLRKDPDAGNDWRQEEKGTTEDEMVGWHHQLDGHGFEQAPGVGEGHGSLACCSPWGCKESDMTEWLNWMFTHLGTCESVVVGWMVLSEMVTFSLNSFMIGRTGRKKNQDTTVPKGPQ